MTGTGMTSTQAETGTGMAGPSARRVPGMELGPGAYSPEVVFKGLICLV